uniref:Dynamin stalk domain-containing protein n=1 Tax=Panagrolaimus davidi TaxID=227884 RepID=A0A914QJ81_9BILA
MGKIIKVKLGIIGVKNRSQADIIADKSVEKCIEEEELFLQNNYPDLADIHGIPYLADTLSKLLISHIHKCLPDLKLKIAKLLERNQNKLATLGEPIIDKNTTILQVISRFAKAYTAARDGNCKDLASNELGGSNYGHIPQPRRVARDYHVGGPHIFHGQTPPPQDD